MISEYDRHTDSAFSNSTKIFGISKFELVDVAIDAVMLFQCLHLAVVATENYQVTKLLDVSEFWRSVNGGRPHKHASRALILTIIITAFWPVGCTRFMMFFPSFAMTFSLFMSMKRHMFLHLATHIHPEVVGETLDSMQEAKEMGEMVMMRLQVHATFDATTIIYSSSICVQTQLYSHVCMFLESD